jgi:hypothetical protein
MGMTNTDDPMREMLERHTNPDDVCDIISAVADGDEHDGDARDVELARAVLATQTVGDVQRFIDALPRYGDR